MSVCYGVGWMHGMTGGAEAIDEGRALAICRLSHIASENHLYFLFLLWQNRWHNIVRFSSLFFHDRTTEGKDFVLVLLCSVVPTRSTLQTSSSPS